MLHKLDNENKKFFEPFSDKGATEIEVDNKGRPWITQTDGSVHYWNETLNVWKDVSLPYCKVK